ncbi:MAG: cytochrome [Sphingobacteriaceae bacterium]|jgi:hypothetical protein|nr:cytochrome [Sphingobacteriaceae bacterium]
MGLKTKILLILVAVFVVIQLFQSPKNNTAPETSADISRVYPMSPNVKATLRKSCYDCHSNSTHYPWYSYIQPFGWWLSSHIEEGKEELNLSQFKDYSARRRKSRLKSMAESIEDGSMPLSSYTFIHNGAKLRDQDRKLLLNWIDSVRASLN